MLKKYDTNGDDKISQAEFIKAVELACKEWEIKLTTQLRNNAIKEFKKHDTSGDGEIDLEELTAVVEGAVQ